MENDLRYPWANTAINLSIQERQGHLLFSSYTIAFHDIQNRGWSRPNFKTMI